MPNTLGLDDDLDPVEVLVSLEKAFALTISDAEAAACSTVGDLYDLLSARFAGLIGQPGSCMTLMAFYRVRRSLRARHPEIDCRPGVALAIYAGVNVRVFLKELRRGSGLRMPEPRGRWLGGVGSILTLAAIIGVAIAVAKGALIFGLASAALLLIGAVLIRVDPGELPEGCATVGDLAIKVGALNYGTLAGAGGAVRSTNLWDAMAEALSGHSDLPVSAMRRDTLLLQSGVT